MWITSVCTSPVRCPASWVISSSVPLRGTTWCCPTNCPLSLEYRPSLARLWCLLRLSKRLYRSQLRDLREKANIILKASKTQLLCKNHSLECKVESGSGFNPSFWEPSIPSICLCSSESFRDGCYCPWLRVWPLVASGHSLAVGSAAGGRVWGQSQTPLLANSHGIFH